jgi:hypothetical protein
MSSEITNRPCPWNGAVANARNVVLLDGRRGDTDGRRPERDDDGGRGRARDDRDDRSRDRRPARDDRRPRDDRPRERDRAPAPPADDFAPPETEDDIPF